MFERKKLFSKEPQICVKKITKEKKKIKKLKQCMHEEMYPQNVDMNGLRSFLTKCDNLFYFILFLFFFQTLEKFSQASPMYWFGFINYSGFWVVVPL